MESVILVDEFDNETGLMEKMEAHEKAMLHRAFSVFIFNKDGDMLLQQRALTKYHSGGLWTNACCSHPRSGETTLHAAIRRLQEEMGFSTALEKVFDFIYKAGFDNGLTEYEFDHVFAGTYDGPVQVNEAEVQAYQYRSMENIYADLMVEKHHYTAWFAIAFPKVYDWWKENKISA
ncbi:MAG: isopentenyl-diphosphate Delta-isomerase [Bacteroidota bacterium]|nr:isopentenyl-diphosphate Delta-isomerase [Bacteroidota bacterium]